MFLKIMNDDLGSKSLRSSIKAGERFLLTPNPANGSASTTRGFCNYSVMLRSSYLKDSGCLYVEVPQELHDQARVRLESGDDPVRLPIHEHIN
jgi:hypothetical protein